MAQPRRWPPFLVLAALATLAVGIDFHSGWQDDLIGVVVSVALPLALALGLLRLAGPSVQIVTVKGVASLLVGMAPLVAALSILGAGVVTCSQADRCASSGHPPLPRPCSRYS